MPWDPTATVSSAQVQAFASRSVVERAKWFPAPLLYNSAEITGVIATSVTQRELLDGGFELVHQAIVRLQRSLNITPALGDTIRDVALGRNYRVAEIRAHAVNPEWVLGLAQL